MESATTQPQGLEQAADLPRPGEPVVSVVIPCLNEAETIAVCVRKALGAIERRGVAGEVIVADNGSTDGSRELARAAGARLVDEPRRGYGSAYLAGFAAARGRYIVMGDGDDTYDFEEIDRFLEPLEGGADLVIGNRMASIRPGAMPWLHRYVGNPLLTGILNVFFRTGVRDAHCGMRGFRREALERLELRTTGMELASEMVIRAAKQGLDIREVPIDYHPRRGESKLSAFRDGWRHLRFLLVHSPNWLFLLPGAILLAIGLAATAIVGLGLSFFGRQWSLHAMVGAAMLTVIGSQLIHMGLGARAYGVYFMGERDRLFDWGRAHLRLEHGLLLGGAVFAVGIAIMAAILGIWIERGFGELSEERLMLVAAVLAIVGLQTVFSSFFISILGLRRRDRGDG